MRLALKAEVRIGAPPRPPSFKDEPPLIEEDDGIADEEVDGEEGDTPVDPKRIRSPGQEHTTPFFSSSSVSPSTGTQHTTQPAFLAPSTPTDPPTPLPFKASQNARSACLPRSVSLFGEERRKNACVPIGRRSTGIGAPGVGSDIGRAEGT